MVELGAAYSGDKTRLTWSITAMASRRLTWTVVRPVFHHQGTRHGTGASGRASDHDSNGRIALGKEELRAGDDLPRRASFETNRIMTPKRIRSPTMTTACAGCSKPSLKRWVYSVRSADGLEALAEIERDPPSLVLSDMKMPNLSGMDLLKRIQSGHAEVPVVMMTAYGTIQSAVEAMRLGAYDYLTKPIDYEELGIVVKRVLEHFRLVAEVRSLRASLDRKYGFENIIGESEPLLALLDTASRAAQSNSTILIHAETGTGKELLARAIHLNSRRRERPFVTINCGAIPRELLESELFGHVKGSFTGAVAHKTGKVEMANGGTLFLDEIGEMPGELQVKVLRLLQEGELEKVGAPSAVKVDVRFVAATHRNLKAMIEDGTFREDLFYRLNVIPLEIPAARPD